MQKRLFDNRVAILRETIGIDGLHYFDLVNDLGTTGLIHSCSYVGATRESFEKAIRKCYEIENITWEERTNENAKVQSGQSRD